MPVARPLEGRRALVTGAAGGLGGAISEMLASAGAGVAVADVRAHHATALARGLESAGGRAVAIAVDLASESACEEAVGTAADALGGLDILVNNAGIDVTVPVSELSIAEWDAIIGVNLRAPFVLSRAAFPHLRDGGAGHIVNIVSTAALRAWPNASAYHASKWGLLGLSHALHAELRPAGIKVTAVISGGMRTPFLLDRFPSIDQSTLQDPEAVANVVRFVLSQPGESVVPEVMVLPMKETSWP